MTPREKWEWNLGLCRDRRGKQDRLPSAPPLPLRPIPASGPIAVGFWTPVWSGIGGTEIWHRTLFKYLDSSLVEIRGLAILDNRRWSATPEGAGLGRDALRRLGMECEVIVAWGLNPIREFLDPFDEHHPKIILVCHGDDSSGWSKTVMSAASPAVDRYVAVSGAALAPIPAERRRDTTIIPNGIDYQRLVPKLSRAAQWEAWGVPPDSKILGFLGRFAAEKRPLVVASALAHLPKHWHAVLVGDGEEIGDVMRKAPQSIRNRLHLPGPTEDIGSALNAFSTFASPSDTEGYCLSLAEAWAAGVPVVSTVVGIAVAHPDLIRAVPIGCTASELAEAILADESDEEATTERVRAARRVVRDRYGAPAMACSWAALLAEVAGRRPGVVAGDTATEVLASTNGHALGGTPGRR